MKKILVWILIMAVPAAVWAYKPPTDYAKVSDRVFINAGQEIELQVRTLDGGTANPNFVKYRNADCRVFLKDKDMFRVLIEINGVVLDNPLITGKISCEANKRQPLWSRFRLEEPVNEPVQQLEIEP